MVNSKDFAKRIEVILNYYELSAAGFADKINVGRSSISHILSGRNKPSLDFVLKIVDSFPEVELYWLLNGKGIFPKSDLSNTSSLPDHKTDLFSPKTETSESSTIVNLPKPTNINTSKNIQKIVIFYDDGSFDAFEN